MVAPKTILVPTDFSRFSDTALEQALDIAKQHNSKIYLFHVIEAIRQCSVDYCIDTATVEDLETKLMKSAQDMMQEQIRRIVKPEDSVEIVPDIRKGNPYQEILSEEQDRDVDLIVIATHGRTGLLHHLTGSVAGKVSKHAKGPVFLVRGRTDAG